MKYPVRATPHSDIFLSLSLSVLPEAHVGANAVIGFVVVALPFQTEAAARWIQRDDRETPLLTKRLCNIL